MREAEGVELSTTPLGSSSAGVGDGAAHVLQEDLTPASLTAAMLYASRETADRLVVYADSGAPAGARLAQWFAPEHSPGHPLSIEIRAVQGAGSVTARAEPMPVVLPEPSDADELVEELAELGLEVVLERGEWRGELLGLEVARIVRWPVETGGDGRLHTEAGVGRFDRDAAAAMHRGETPRQGLARAIGIVSEHRYPGAPTHPLSLLARARWMRSVAIGSPGSVGASELVAVESTFAARSVRDECPAAALGITDTGTPLLTVFGVGASLDLLAVATDTRELHLPGGLLRVVLPPRDHLAVTDQLAGWATAANRGPVEVIEMDAPWAA